MVARRMPRTLNPGNVLVLVGVAALGLSFWLPHLTAARMFEKEQRAESLARRLCEAARSTPDLDLASPQAQREILARIGGRRLQPLEPPGPLRGKALLFGTKHYYLMLTRTPPETKADNTPPVTIPHQEPAPEAAWRWPWRFAASTTQLPFEVYAWPATLIGPGIAVFFHPSDAPPAFCRNLDHTYHGLAKYPLPGKARKQNEGRQRRGMLKWYRGFDDARWLFPLSDADGERDRSP